MERATSHHRPLGVTIISIVLGIAGIFSLIFALGLWRLKRWAFWLTVILAMISIVRHLVELTHPVHSTPSIIGLILPVFILLYFLFDPKVRRALRV